MRILLIRSATILALAALPAFAIFVARKPLLRLLRRWWGRGKLGSEPLDSVYYSSARRVLGELNRVSPSMCLAKWFNVSIHLTTGRTHSCYHPPSHEIPLGELAVTPSALHNTEYKKKQRQLMLDGKRPSECAYCWQIEDANPQALSLSDRAYRSNDVFTPKLLRQAVAAGSRQNVNPVYVEVNFNQACNFKCSYCSPHLSTTWLKEIQQHGPYDLIHSKHNDLEGLRQAGLMPDLEHSKQYVDAFWQWWPDLYRTLKHFRMTGGEPLMDKNTFRIFEYIQRHPKPDLKLAVTSNCCPHPEMWRNFMRAIRKMEEENACENFTLYCSLDSWGEQAAYIRNGMEFDVLWRNICEFLENSSKTTLTFIVTFNNLSVVGFRRFLEGVLELRARFSTRRQRIWFDTPMLHAPEWMSLHTLSPRYRDVMLADIEFVERHLETAGTRFKGFKDFELDRLRKIHRWMGREVPIEKLQHDRANFALYFKQIDERRKTSLRDAFPEMTDFFDLCEGSLASSRARP